MTRLQFLSYITRTLKRTDKNTEIYESLNETIRDVSGRARFQEYQFQSYVACVSGQEDYPLPSTLLHIQHPVRLLDGSATNDNGNQLTHISKAEYDRREPNPNRTSPSVGRPGAYTIYSNSILLTPIPDDTYLIEIDWGNVPTNLAADGESPSFNEMWDEVLKHGVLFRMFALLGMYEDAEYWRGHYELGIKRMIDINSDKTGNWIGAVRNNSL